MQRLFGGLMATVVLVSLSEVMFRSMAQDVPAVPSAPQGGVFIVGQYGVLQVTPDGISTLVPDRGSGYLRPGSPSQQQQAGVAQPQQPQQQPVVCECACPACPAPGPTAIPDVPLQAAPSNPDDSTDSE